MVNGRFRIHGGLSTGPKTKEGKRRVADAQKSTVGCVERSSCSGAPLLTADGSRYLTNRRACPFPILCLRILNQRLESINRFRAGYYPIVTPVPSRV
ncbi:MAG: HGGxSTG domain-containing protein [Gammaproteobacteria bacterium]